MSRLLLIKHSLPVIDPGTPASEWELSEEGQQRCISLAQQATEYAPDIIVCSLEPKASKTGQLLAKHLGLPWQAAKNLHEHERPQAKLWSQQEFNNQVERLFSYPDQVVFGTESAFQAKERFEQALTDVLNSHSRKTVAIVTHGTVISLFLADKTDTPAFPLWKSLGLPSLVVLSLPNFRIEKIVKHIELISGKT